MYEISLKVIFIFVTITWKNNISNKTGMPKNAIDFIVSIDTICKNAILATHKYSFYIHNILPFAY